MEDLMNLALTDIRLRFAFCERDWDYPISAYVGRKKTSG